MSKTVYVIVEGPTERKFIADILAPYLWIKEIYLTPIEVGKVGQKGGDVSFKRVTQNLKALKSANIDTYMTLFVDYYGVDKQWPGYQESLLQSTIESKAAMVNSTTKAAVNKLYPQMQFIPYVAMHEFEALLFSDTEKLAEGIHISSTQVADILAPYNSPEEINNSEATAPSKRLDSLVGGKFLKTTSGIAIARNIGVDIIRDKCKIFNQWLSTIESL